MPRLILISCHIKFQLRVGYFPDGRARTRTFGIKDVRPDVSADDVAAVARAVAPLLAHEIIRVTLVKKYDLVTDDVVECAYENEPGWVVFGERNEDSKSEDVKHESRDFFVGVDGMYSVDRARGTRADKKTAAIVGAQILRPLPLTRRNRSNA